jgi:NAD(P)-dependent dehydrogenase (short-subunit alcohol dehydrogenase family)
MSEMLQGATVLVVGAGAGLGAEVAQASRREGANVVLAARTVSTLEQVAEQVDPSGAAVAWQQTDIRDADQCKRVADLCVSRFGRLDAVVSCAVAGDALVGGLLDTDFDDWRDLFETNVIGTMQMVRSAVDAMTSGGSVVFIGSQAAFFPNVVQLAYGASKAAVVGATVHLAAELGPRGVRVNTVAPGWMWGPSLAENLGKSAGGDSAEIIAKIGRKLPLRTVAEDGDVAEAAVFLASPRAKAITGQCLLVNAGEYSR